MSAWVMAEFASEIASIAWAVEADAAISIDAGEEPVAAATDCTMASADAAGATVVTAATTAP